MLLRVVTVLADASRQRELNRRLSQHDVLAASPRIESGDFWTQLGRETSDLVVISRALVPGDVDAAVARLKALPERPALVFLSRERDAAERPRLLAAGVDAVLGEALPVQAIVDVLENHLAARRHQIQQALPLRECLQEPRFSDFVSESPAMQAFMRLVHRVARSDTSLLILGETGVGKERLARAIHAEGGRAAEPFIAVNCGAMPENLLESELFGHERGAFTGAVRAHRGCFELAHKGTLLLDEIGELPYHLQVKLLRVLQEREIQRLGGERPIEVDVRIMAATNADLEEVVRLRRFRQDLFYRLNVVSLTVPSLRERWADIPLLVRRYIEYLNQSITTAVTAIAPEALVALERYDWPGNVRELVNVLERALLLCDGDAITLADLPESIHRLGGQRVPGASAYPAEWRLLPWKEARARGLADLEAWYCRGLLEATAGRVGEAAARAGLNPRSLHEKMDRHGLDRRAFRS